MKKDIQFPPVTGVSIAIIKEDETKDSLWRVYFINKNAFELSQVMITSRGYGNIEGEPRATSLLRHAFTYIEPNSFHIVEPIDPAVFPLNNEYWVSYFVGDQIYDKKFVFVPDSIVEEHLVVVPHIQKLGILHD